MFDESMIEGDRLQARQRVVAQFPIRLPWYRSLPLSSIERIDVSIDGKSVDRGNLSFGLYGQAHPIDRLLSLPDVLWFVLDSAELSATVEEPIGEGEHEVHVAMELRIPYSAKPFKQVAHCTKRLRLGAELLA